jgi:hypothetical protein
MEPRIFTDGAKMPSELHRPAMRDAARSIDWRASGTGR